MTVTMNIPSLTYETLAGQFTLVSLETFELQSVLCPHLELSVDESGERRILVDGLVVRNQNPQQILA